MLIRARVGVQRSSTPVHLAGGRDLALGGRPRPISLDREEFLIVDHRTVPGLDDVVATAPDLVCVWQ